MNFTAFSHFFSSDCLADASACFCNLLLLHIPKLLYLKNREDLDH